jgi:hypothetical protein
MRFLWAEQIRAEDAGDHIRVEGANRSDNRVTGLLNRYAKLPTDPGPENASQRDMPLLRFANASSRDELFRFVGDFGPIVLSERPQAPDHLIDPSVDFLEAKQSWKELESEQRLFQNLLRLLQIVRADKAEEELRASLLIFDEILRCTSDWVRQCQRESSGRRGSYLAPCAWNWTEDQQAALDRRFDAARDVLSTDSPSSELVRILARGDPIVNVNTAICEVLNAFPTYLQFFFFGEEGKPRAVEMPRSDLSFGIRPALYFMLRTDYLQGWERRLCGRIGCGTWFTPTGHRPHHCSAICARKVRQKKSWEIKGRETRQARVAKAKEFATKNQTGRAKGSD